MNDYSAVRVDISAFAGREPVPEQKLTNSIMGFIFATPGSAAAVKEEFGLKEIRLERKGGVASVVLDNCRVTCSLSYSGDMVLISTLHLSEMAMPRSWGKERNTAAKLYRALDSFMRNNINSLHEDKSRKGMEKKLKTFRKALAGNGLFQIIGVELVTSKQARVSRAVR